MSEHTRSITGSEIAARATALISSKAFGAIARITGLIVLARYLPKEDFGVVSFVLITYLSISALISFGLPDSIYYFYEKHPNSRRRVYRLLAKLLVLVAMGGAFILVGIAYVADTRGYDVMGMFLPLILLLLIDIPISPVNHALIAIGRAKLAAALNAVFSLCLFCALVLPPLLDLPKEVIAYSFLIYGLIRMVVSLMFFNRHVHGDETLPRGLGTVKIILQYAVPLGIANITWKLNQFIDKYVVMFFLPVTIFAEYSVGAWELPIVPIIASSVAMVMMSRLVNRYLSGDFRSVALLWVRSIEKISLIVLPIMVLLVVISKDLIATLFPDNYIAAYLVFAVYSLGLFQRVCDNGMLLRAINETKAITRWALYTLVLNLCLSIPLVIWMGMVGAAVATLCANFLTWFYALSRVSKSLEVEIGEVFPFKIYGQVLLTAIVSAVPIVILQDYFSSSHPMALAWKIIIYLLTYSVISTLAGLCNRQDWIFMGRLLSFRSQQAGY